MHLAYDSHANRLVSFEDGYLNRPAHITRLSAYDVPADALAHGLRTDRPNDEVRLADPDALDQEASSFAPHMIVCSDNASEVGEEVSVLSWIVIRYHDSMSASVFLDEQDTRLIQDISI